MACEEKNLGYGSIYLHEPCVKQTVVTMAAPWNRLSSRCQNNALLFSSSELQMRRKAEVLQYKGLSWQTKSMKYADVARKNSNRPLTRALELRCLAAVNSNKLWSAPASASNVPGRMMLYYDRSIPYIPIGRREEKSNEDTDYL